MTDKKESIKPHRKYTPRGLAFHNPEPGATPTIDVSPKKWVKIEFGNRLLHQIRLAGITQSDLARRASERLPPGKAIGRDSISSYVRGEQLPQPAKLKAIADVFGLKHTDLLPPEGVPSTVSAARMPPFEMRDTEDGMVHVRVDMMMPYEYGLKVGAIVRKVREGRGNNHDK